MLLYTCTPIDRAEMENSYDDQSIAVIGLSCRFPGDADNVERFWKLLREGQCKFGYVLISVVLFSIFMPFCHADVVFD